MSLLELRIPNETDSGYFDTVIVYKEKNFEMKLSQFFAYTTKLQANFFDSVNELAIFYDDKPITLPTEIAANLLKYLINFNKAYNIHSEFTCHQFAFLLTKGKYIAKYGFNFSSKTQSHLSPGEVIHFAKQEGAFGDSNLDFKTIHSALFLGEGLFFSKNGGGFPAICTLEAMVETYPCDYITVSRNAVLNEDSITDVSSIYLNFKHNNYRQNGLAFRALNTFCKSFIQFSPQAINTLYRKAALKFHPDSTSLPKEQAKVFFELTQKMHDFLLDPIKRSDYNVSLLAGNDWSIARILGLCVDPIDYVNVKTGFEEFIALLNHYKLLTANEEQKIKNDPYYKRALSLTSVSSDSNLVIQISSDIGHLSNQDPHHPTSVTFEGQTKYFGDALDFKMTEDKHVGDLRIYSGNPVKINFNKHEFNEKSMQSIEWLEKLPTDLISYSDIQNALQLLELWYASRSDGKMVSPIPSLYMKKHLTQYPDSLAFFLNKQSQVLNVAVFLGGNFYLFYPDSKAKEVCIANVAFLHKDSALSTIGLLTHRDMRSTYTNKQQIAATSKLFITRTLFMSQEETFPQFSQLQTEAFKCYLLSFNSEKDNAFIPYLNGLKLKSTTPIQYKVTQEKYNTLEAGQGVLLCDGSRAVTQAFYLGNNLFVLASTTGYLRIVNLLMLSETIVWDSLYIMKWVIQSPEKEYSCTVAEYKKKIALKEMKQPLLYAILGIPFDLTNLSAITEQMVIDCYRNRMDGETDPEVHKVLSCAYKLLMNDSYRIFYGSEILFGGERELMVCTLLELGNATPQEIVKRYFACLTLINNVELKDRISKEYTLKSAKSDLTIEFIDTLLSNSGMTNNMSFLESGCCRWISYFKTNHHTHKSNVPSYKEIFSACPEAQEVFEKLEKQFELQKIDLKKLSYMGVQKLFEYIWQTMEKKPQKRLAESKEESQYSLSELASSTFFTTPTEQTKEEHVTEKLKQRLKIKLDELGIEGEIDFSF